MRPGALVLAFVLIVGAAAVGPVSADTIPVKIFPAECVTGTCTSPAACLAADRASLATWRARCDEFAEGLGWVHGVFRPEHAADRFCPADSQAYVCEGVGAAVYGGFCGGIAGFPCPAGYQCVDAPGDSCDPNAGGADCGGICVRPK